MAPKAACTVCRGLLQKGIVTFEGKKFCCQTCCNKFKDSKKKKVCEFC